MWEKWRNTVIEATKNVLKEEEMEKKKEAWTTDETLRAMDQRRGIRNRESAEYKNANKEIKRMRREAKNK